MKKSMRFFLLVVLCAASWQAQFQVANAQGAATFVYTNNDRIPNSVSAFVAAANGSLSPVPGSPFLTGGNGAGGGFFAANRITAAVVKNFLYAANSGSNTVTAFLIDPATGALSPVPGSPFATGGVAGGGSRAGGLDLRAPSLELGPQLGEPLLALPGELLQLDQLLLDIVEIGGEIAPELAYGPPTHAQRVRDLLLHLDQVGELGCVRRVAPRGFSLEEQDVRLYRLDVALGGAADESRPPHQGGDERAGEHPAVRHHWGATRLSPPAVISNSSRRFWA